MVFNERVYATLVVSSFEKFNHTVQPLLTAAHCEPVNFAGNVSAAKRLLNEKQYDFVIINTPVPTEPATKLATDISAEAGTVCLILTKGDFHAEIRAGLTPYGVFALSLPTSAAALTGGLEFLASARERLRFSEKKTVSLDEKMEEIRLINRAKWLLIENMNLSEPDAHRYIEKEAMNTRATRREVAEKIINTYT